MKRLSALWMLATVFCCARAQETGGNWLTFTLDRSGTVPVHYSIRVDAETGHGFYRSDLPTYGASGVQPKAGEIPVTIEAVTVKKLFAAVPLVKSGRCDSHNKSIAQTGVKTLHYTSGSAAFECTYNYGLDDRVNTATGLFEALAETMQYGDRLSAKLRFDRLGLDAEIDDLAAAVHEGRALEIGNIAPVLTAIENDERVMERVRRKATILLEAAQQGSQRAEDKDWSER